MSTGDSEHPISFRFEPRYEGAHVKVKVWAGTAGFRGLAGEITLRPEEFAVLRFALATAPLPPLENFRLEGGGRDGRGTDRWMRVNMEPFEFGEFNAETSHT